MTSGGGFSGRRRNSGYVIIGGTSRGGVTEVLAFVGISDGVGEAACVLLSEDALSCTVRISECSSLSLVPRSICMSSLWRPFCSRNDTLRSVGAPRIDSSSSQRLAWSSSCASDLRMLSECEVWSLPGDSGAVDDWISFLCQSGIAGLLAPEESAIVEIALREVEGWWKGVSGVVAGCQRIGCGIPKAEATMVGLSLTSARSGDTYHVLEAT